MTSNNEVRFSIFNKDGEKVGSHRIHILCKSHWGDLMHFTPLDEHTIVTHNEVEDDDSEECFYYDSDPVNLFDFLCSAYGTRAMLAKRNNYTLEQIEKSVRKNEYYFDSDPKKEDKIKWAANFIKNHPDYQ
jgi:hypothetical protein